MKATKVFDSRQSLEKIFEEQPIRRLRISGTKICIAQHNGEFFAFELLCPHQNHPLDEGSITDFGEVVCPLHSYRFDLKKGGAAAQNCRDLKTYPIEIQNDGVYIKLH